MGCASFLKNAGSASRQKRLSAPICGRLRKRRPAPEICALPPTVDRAGMQTGFGPWRWQRWPRERPRWAAMKARPSWERLSHRGSCGGEENAKSLSTNKHEKLCSLKFVVIRGLSFVTEPVLAPTGGRCQHYGSYFYAHETYTQKSRGVDAARTL